MRARRVCSAIVLATFLPTAAFAQQPVSLSHAVKMWEAPAGFVLESSSQVADCSLSRERGRADASDRHSALGWFVGGVGAGVGAGFIGTGVITAVPAFGSPQPKEIPANLEEGCYRDGYKSKAKSKNIVSALLGGAVGTAAFVAIWMVGNSASDGY